MKKYRIQEKFLCGKRIDFSCGGCYVNNRNGSLDCGKGDSMKYFIFLFSIIAWGALGLIIGKGVAGTWREESNADKKARILNDPDIQTCTHDSEK